MSDVSTEHLTPSSGVTLPYDSTGPRRARQLVMDLLGDRLTGEAADTVELLVSEVVTNALAHAGSSCRLSAHVVAGRTRVEVRDSQPSPPRLSAAGPEDSQGRGLWLVDALAADWGVESVSGHGKAVWFEVVL